MHLSKFTTEALLESLSVALPMGKLVVCSKVATRCLLALCRYVLFLVVLKLLKFDIILSMNWLSQHYAYINCL